MKIAAAPGSWSARSALVPRGKHAHVATAGLAGLLVAIVGACSSVLGQPPSTDSPAITISQLEPGQVQRGRQVYVEYCASCHGSDAQGTPDWQRPDGSGNLPPPPHDDSGHTWRHSDAQLAQIIREGTRDPFNRSPDLTMPAFGDRLTHEEIEAVIAYFKSLWSGEHRVYQEEQNHRVPAMPEAPR